MGPGRRSWQHGPVGESTEVLEKREVPTLHCADARCTNKVIVARRAVLCTECYKAYLCIRTPQLPLSEASNIVHTSSHQTDPTITLDALSSPPQAVVTNIRRGHFESAFLPMDQLHPHQVPLWSFDAPPQFPELLILPLPSRRFPQSLSEPTPSPIRGISHVWPLGSPSQIPSPTDRQGPAPRCESFAFLPSPGCTAPDNQVYGNLYGYTLEATGMEVDSADDTWSSASCCYDSVTLGTEILELSKECPCTEEASGNRKEPCWQAAPPQHTSLLRKEPGRLPGLPLLSAQQHLTSESDILASATGSTPGTPCSSHSSLSPRCPLDSPCSDIGQWPVSAELDLEGVFQSWASPDH